MNVVKRRKSIAQILAEVEAEPRPKHDVSPGGYNSAGELFDPTGHVLQRVRRNITPAVAQQQVRDGAQLAWEGCGCGGWSGCVPIWITADIRAALGTGLKPRFTGRHNAPTWIDLWHGDNGPVVYAHGDVKWADAFE